MARGVNEGNSVRLFVRMQPEQRDEARQAAKLMGVEFSEWIRQAIDLAAKGIIATHLPRKKPRRKLAKR